MWLNLQIQVNMYVVTYIATYNNDSHINVCIKTHGSESRGQEEAGLRDERVSYLQVAPL